MVDIRFLGIAFTKTCYIDRKISVKTDFIAIATRLYFCKVHTFNEFSQVHFTAGI